MMNEIAIIGRVAGNKELYDGQTVLTRMFKDELEEQTHKRIICVDTYEYKKNFVKCFFKTIYVLFKCDCIFILLSRNGLKFYLPFLYYLNKFFKKKIYHRVIGGCLQDLIKKNKNWKKYLNAMVKNFVETNAMKKSLEELDIKNVVVSPNFKKINIVSENEIKTRKEEKIYKFCTFSRVTKEKGITIAIDAIKYLVNENFKVHLDIYGPIDDSYRKEFYEKISNNDNVTYKGCIDPRMAVNTIKNYYMLLFPTVWEGEGFPGTLIDAFSAGVPVIATDWNFNSEIIKDQYTGLIYNYKNQLLLQDKMIYSIENKEIIYKMRLNCIKEAEKYNAEKVVSEIIKEM